MKYFNIRNMALFSMGILLLNSCETEDELEQGTGLDSEVTTTEGQVVEVTTTDGQIIKIIDHIGVTKDLEPQGASVSGKILKIKDNFETELVTIDEAFLESMGGEWTTRSKNLDRFKVERETKDKPDAVCFSPSYNRSNRQPIGVFPFDTYRTFPNVCKEAILKDNPAQFKMVFKKFGKSSKFVAIGPVRIESVKNRTNDTNKKVSRTLKHKVTTETFTEVTNVSETNISGSSNYTIKLPEVGNLSINFSKQTKTSKKTVRSKKQTSTDKPRRTFSIGKQMICQFILRSQLQRQNTTYIGSLRFRGNVGAYYKKGKKQPVRKLGVPTSNFFYQSTTGKGRQYTKNITVSNIVRVFEWSQNDCDRIQPKKVQR